MNKTQSAYAVAKTVYNMALAKLNAELETINDLAETNPELFETRYNEICDKHDTYAYFKIMRAAENEMIEWANAKVAKSKHFAPRHKKAIADIMANINQPKIRQTMVDLAFRLE